MVEQYFVEVASFTDFARYVCAYREYPLRTYSFEYKKNKVFSTQTVLANSILHFFCNFSKKGRYVQYGFGAGKETADVVNTAKKVSNYSPIVHIENLPFRIRTPKRIKDKFKPIKVADLGSLARLTYDPEWPEELKLALFAFPHKRKWIIGYPTQIELDDIVYCFNYVELDSEPNGPFLKYSGHEGKPPEFTTKFQHGFPYLPIIKLKQGHQLFGL